MRIANSSPCESSLLLSLKTVAWVCHTDDCIITKSCLPAGHLSRRVVMLGPCKHLQRKQCFFSYKISIPVEERYPWGASPAVLCKTGLCKIIETKGFRSTETFSITWAMNGMRGMLISSRIFFFSKTNTQDFSLDRRATLTHHLSSCRECTHTSEGTRTIRPSLYPTPQEVICLTLFNLLYFLQFFPQQSLWCTFGSGQALQLLQFWLGPGPTCSDTGRKCYFNTMLTKYKEAGTWCTCGSANCQR